MRVIAGTARHLPLKAPEGLETRPTIDRTKETLFNILQPYLAGSDFLDLVAGSGAIGIEALSRGARNCYFIEQKAEAQKCIVENLKFTKLIDKARLVRGDVFTELIRLKSEGRKFDFIFMDPPYDHEYEKKVLEILADGVLLKDDTWIIVEASLATDFSYVEELGYETVKEKNYKTNRHIIFRPVVKE
ncbi:MAG: 16S rRNA (guanine(966)-N(2))-methyltransferase RsmD [Lachnospiraceae bacterium]|nr:16S rRNA (guanine(966)-N(2))-methyltransferase RsmD [Lachnospiraceae bacterium]